MTLIDALVPKSPPIQMDSHGVARVGGTRVTLDTILWAYKAGESAEQIHDAYSSVSVADIHEVIAFYLNNQEGVDHYLAEQERLADEIQAKIEARWPSSDLKAKLLARKSLREQGNDSAAG